MSALVDTNVVSELVRPQPNPGVAQWFATEGASGFALSVVTIEELSFGVARAPATRRPKLTVWLEALIATALVIPVSLEVARTAGRLRAAREARGRRVAQPDMLLAATAHTHRLAFLTRNESDFAGCGIDVINPFD